MSIPTRVLLIDSSIVFRDIIRKRFHECSQVHMLPAAADSFEALHLANKYHPDVIICSNELYFMNGIDLIKKHLSKCNVPIIAMSVHSELKDEALQAGAMYFVVKPRSTACGDGLAFTNMLLKLTIKLGQRRLYEVFNQSAQSSCLIPKLNSSRKKIIAVGATLESADAIVNLLSKIPSNSPPVLLMYKGAHEHSCLLIERLKETCSMNVKEALDGDYLKLGTIMVASTERTIGLQSDDCNYYISRLHQHQPSPMDYFFQSIAATMGNGAIGILLNASEEDGVKGLHQLKRTGATVFLRQSDGKTSFSVRNLQEINKFFQTTYFSSTPSK